MPGSQVTSVDPLLRTISFADRELPIGTLHLSNRAVNWLTHDGVNSVGDLLDRTEADPSLSFATPPRTPPEVAVCLDLISNSAGPKGSVDWIGYAERHGAQILPDTKGDISFDVFARDFVTVIKTAVALQYGPTHQAILESFIGEPGMSLPPLSRLARKDGCSRQAIAQLKDGLITALQKAVFRDDYADCRFRLRPAFVSHVRQLDTSLRALRSEVIAYKDWQRVLASSGAKPAERLHQAEGLLLRLLGYHIVRQAKPPCHPIVTSIQRDVTPIRWMLAKCYSLLTDECPAGLSEEQIFKKLNTDDRVGRLRRRDMPVILGALVGIEYSPPTSSWKAEGGHLRRMNDQLHQILSDRGSAMSARELAAEIRNSNGRLHARRTSWQVVTAMGADKRFQPIGKSGYWVLRKWKQRAETAKDAAFRFIAEAKRPLTQGELYSRLKLERPIKRSTIGNVLALDARFRRIAKGTWALVQEDLPG